MDQLTLVVLVVLHFVAAAYATSILAYYVVYERGPKDLFVWFRKKVGINIPYLEEPIYLEDVEVETYEDLLAMGIEPEDFPFIMARISYKSDNSWLAEAFSCHRCAIPYCTVFILLTFLFPPLFYFLALCGLTLTILERYKK